MHVDWIFWLYLLILFLDQKLKKKLISDFSFRFIAIFQHFTITAWPSFAVVCGGLGRFSHMTSYKLCLYYTRELCLRLLLVVRVQKSLVFETKHTQNRDSWIWLWEWLRNNRQRLHFSCRNWTFWHLIRWKLSQARKKNRSRQLITKTHAMMKLVWNRIFHTMGSSSRAKNGWTNLPETCFTLRLIYSFSIEHMTLPLLAPHSTNWAN